MLDYRNIIELKVIKTSPEDFFTDLYSVIADYGWCERILCSESYLHDANEIAEAIAKKYNICELKLASKQHSLKPLPVG